MATFKFEVQKEGKDGTFNIKILMTHNRKLKRLPTSIYITKSDMTRTGKIKNQSVLDRLEDIIKDYRRKCNKLPIINSMDTNQVAEYLKEKETVSIDFIEVFRAYIRCA